VNTRTIDAGAQPNQHLSTLSTNFNFLPLSLTHPKEDTHQFQMKAPVIETDSTCNGETGADRLAETLLARHDYF
jgi:hypothetical protein